jgi:hypothetical protein
MTRPCFKGVKAPYQISATAALPYCCYSSFLPSRFRAAKANLLLSRSNSYAALARVGSWWSMLRLTKLMKVPPTRTSDLSEPPLLVMDLVGSYVLLFAPPAFGFPCCD